MKSYYVKAKNCTVTGYVEAHSEEEAIEIFNIEKQDYIFSENIEDSFPQIELSEFYYDIFLTASNYDIKIWKI